MRSNTTTTRVFALAAAAACAAGLSACQSDVPVPEPTAGGGTATAAPSAGTEQPTSTTPTGAAPTSTPTGAAPTSTPTAAPSAGAAEAQNIEPITFTDEAVGLTETCDQIITDFKAPSYQTGSDADTTVYLLHCTLDYSGDLSYNTETVGDLKLVDDKDEYHYGRAWGMSSVEDDVKAAGLNPIGYDDYGTNHVDGWFSFTVSGSDGKADPLPEGATTLTYERSSFTNKGTGKTYEAYSTRSKVTIK
ncbi:hypothetical protein [Actinomyces dentalis]|uniref:hypothetical protein n=1 Tax=Actinomyces dentalis TaxID=272548 RepID=UPI0004082417|nr:hypothetical protein [Actinomyces dentalis]